MTITLETDAGTVTLMPEEYELFLEDSIRQANARVYGQGFFDRKYTVDEDTPDLECHWEEPGIWLAPGSPPLEDMSWSRWTGTDLEGIWNPDRLVAEHRLECDRETLEPAVDRQANDRLFVESLSDIIGAGVSASVSTARRPVWATDVRIPEVPPPVQFGTHIISCDDPGCYACG